jgi:integrase
MHLYRRRGTYHFRIRIPLDLLEAIPSPELIKSLKTKDRKLAQTAVKPYAQKTQEVFTLLRIGMLSPAQAQERLDTVLQRKRPAVVPTTAAEITLAAAVRQFIADRQHGWGPKTKLENEGTYRLVVDILGDISVRSISRTVARELREKLLLLPANMYKVFPEKSANEVLAMEDLTPMSISSVNKHVSRFSTFLKYCRDEYGLEDNAALGLCIRQKRRTDEERKVYTQEDIGKMLAALPAPSDKPERYWIPIIGLYSGMRLDEIAQLYTSDVRDIDGTLCFDLNEDDDRKLKTLSSRRVVPVHPRLLELGFLRYVEEARRQEHPRLWMNLNRRESDGYSNAIGKWFQRFNRKHITDDLQKSFHSLRHSFADTLKQKGVQESMISELMGHVNSSITTGRYGKRFQPGLLLEALNMLSYS